MDRARYYGEMEEMKYKSLLADYSKAVTSQSTLEIRNSL